MLVCKTCKSKNVSSKKNNDSKFEFQCFDCGRTVVIRRPLNYDKKQLLNAKC